MSLPPTELRGIKEVPSDSGGSKDPLSIPPAVKAGIRILLVDDERTLRESCASVLQMDGYSVTLAGRGEEALDLLKNRRFDIVLVDLYMSQVSGLEILKAALTSNKDSIVVVMTGNPSVTTSIEALRAGAWDYLPKPFSATHLQVLIGRASHAVMVAREANDLRQQLVEQQSHGESGVMIGISPLFRKAIELARKVAPTDASVFISGESGTGKRGHCPFHSPEQPTVQEDPGADQLCSVARAPPRIRNVRPSQRSLHRGGPRQARPPRNGERGHLVPR